MGSLTGAIDRICVLQKSISLSKAAGDPWDETVKDAHRYPPGDQRTLLPDVPCWMNEWTLNSERRFSGAHTCLYTVHMVLFVYDANKDTAADIATRLYEKALAAFDADVTLSSTVTQQTIRGGSPTLGQATYGDKTYIGVELFMDITLTENATIAP